MIKLFWRLALISLLTIFLSWTVADFLLRKQVKTFQAKVHQSWVSTMLKAYQSERNIADLETRKQTLENVSDPLLYEIQVLPIATLDLSDEELKSLSENALVIHMDPGDWTDWATIYAADLDPNYAIQLDYGSGHAQADFNYYTTVLACLFIGLAIVIFFLMTPVIRWLHTLSQTALAYSSGDFSKRVPKGGPTAIAELGASFNHMAEALTQAKDHHEIMTHALSHEVRTPLARLRLSLDMVEEMDLEEDVALFLGEMQRDVDDLESLSDETLQLARLTFANEPLPMKPLDVGHILNKAKAAHQLIEPTIKIQLLTDKEILAMGHAPLLTRALGNLVRNAQKYGANQIYLSASCHDGIAQLTVEDNGPGIPTDLRNKALAPFQRLGHTRSISKDGVGLGMAIVARIMDAHQGHVYLENSSFGGAAIRLQWPQ